MMPDSSPGTTVSVDTDKPCIGCSYNLKGLPLTGPCPECGRPVADSLQGFLLQNANPVYRARLLRGLGFILGGFLLAVVFLAIAFLSALAGGGSAGWLGAVAFIFAHALLLTGYWLYSTRDPADRGRREPVMSRRVLRVATAVLIAWLAGGMLVALFPDNPYSTTSDLVDFFGAMVSVVVAGAWIVHFFACLHYTGWIATRIPHDGLGRRARRFMWLLPLLAVAPLVVAFPTAWVVLDVLKADDGAALTFLLVVVISCFGAMVIALGLYAHLFLSIRRHILRPHRPPS